MKKENKDLKKQENKKFEWIELIKFPLYATIVIIAWIFIVNIFSCYNNVGAMAIDKKTKKEDIVQSIKSNDSVNSLFLNYQQYESMDNTIEENNDKLIYVYCICQIFIIIISILYFIYAFWLDKVLSHKSLKNPFTKDNIKNLDYAIIFSWIIIIVEFFFILMAGALSNVANVNLSFKDELGLISLSTLGFLYLVRYLIKYHLNKDNKEV